MPKKRVKKSAMTLIEIMIVIFLIASITGVLAYNYKGSLEKGKKFKTEMAMQKLHTILDLAVAEDPNLLDSIESNWEDIVRNSPLVNDKRSLIYDGWNKKYQVRFDRNQGIQIASETYNADHINGA
jgi:general secretion pathway protein G